MENDKSKVIEIFRFFIKIIKVFCIISWFKEQFKFVSLLGQKMLITFSIITFIEDGIGTNGNKLFL